MPTTDIKNELKKQNLKLADLPESIANQITEHDAKYAAWNTDFKRYSKSPDDFDEPEVTALRKLESEVNAMEDDLINQIVQHRIDLDKAADEQKLKDQEAERIKKEQEEADKLKQQKEQEEADRLKAQQEEEERLRLEKEEKEKNSGSLGKGLLVGSILLVLTLGAVNLFKNK